MDPEKKKFELYFPHLNMYIIPKSLKFSHWPSKILDAMGKRSFDVSWENVRPWT